LYQKNFTIGGIFLKFKRFSILFTLVLAFSTFFSSFAFAENNVKPNLVSLGDSITYGWNLEKDTDPTNSQQSLKAFPYLIGNGKYNVAKNISGGGWTSEVLLTEIQKPENLAAISTADIITLNIGSNDLLKSPGIALALSNPTAILTPEQIINLKGEALIVSQKLAIKITAIMTGIKTVNPNAKIILYNIYNPIGVGPIHDLAEQIIPSMNVGVFKPIVDTFGLQLADAYTAFNGNQATYVLPGDIHPTPDGHKALASAGEQALSVLTTIPVLAPSTLEQTSDPVTINVTTSAKKVLALKWLSGEKTVNDFATTGNAITDNKFQATENGTYTVYLFDGLGLESVATIKIDNIKKADPTPIPVTNPTPTTVNPVTPIPITATTSGNLLPNTATPMYNYLALGLGLILTGLVARKNQKYRRRENS
jgi:lysophospholipase L1-like esterase